MLDKVYAIWVNKDLEGKGSIKIKIHENTTYLIKAEAQWNADKLNEEDSENNYTVEPLSVR